MPTYTALTNLPGREAAEALGTAMERLSPEPTGVGVFELEDGSGLWEVGGYFVEAPDDGAMAGQGGELLTLNSQTGWLTFQSQAGGADF